MINMLYKAIYPSPIGELTIVSDKENLVGLWIKNQKYFASTVKEKMIEKQDLPILQQTINWLNSYFKGEKPSCQKIPLKPSGSAFRQSVWKILCEIPYGEVITYKEIAQKIAKMQHKEIMSAQAVGGAVGHNPISIIIPCHRVIGTDGSLTGYAGGLAIKRKLLQLENAHY